MGSDDENVRIPVEFANIRVRECVPAIVYHYTTPEGLLGLLQTLTFRASHFAFLNDPAELAIEHAGAREVLMRVYSDLPTGLEVVRSVLEVLSKQDAISQRELYIASFSEDPDSLPQWRAYSDDGRGYALGFKLDLSQWHLDNASVSAERCIYGEEEFEALLGDELARMKPYAEHVLARHLISSFQVAAVQAAMTDRWLEYAARFKDKAYATEKEWRLVCSRPLGEAGLQPTFRPSRFGLTPSVPLGFAPEALVDICIGPTLPKEQAEAALLLLLAANDLPRLPIRRSAIRYR